MRVNIPCGPVRISREKLRSIIQIMAEISTPKAGGTSSLTGRSSGSVGQTTALYGNLVISVFGYQERIVLQMKKKLRTFTRRSNVGRSAEMRVSVIPSFEPTSARIVPGKHVIAVALHVNM